MQKIAVISLSVLIAGGGVFWWSQRDGSSPATAEDAPTQVRRERDGRVQAGDSNDSNKKPELNPKLAQLTDTSIAWQKRIELCDQLLQAEELRSTDIAALYAMLGQPTPTEGNRAREAWFVVANEIMELMRERGLGAADYSAEMSALIVDPSLHPVIRDYAVQHLSMWLYPATADAPGESDPAARARGLELFAKAIANPANSHTSIPGTTLMALADLSERAPAEDTAPIWQSLSPAIRSWFAPDSSATLPNRVSALQAISRAGVEELHPMVRELSTQPGNASVRLSAVAALGFYGKSEDIKYLNTIAQNEPRLRHAVHTAVQRIEER